MRFSAWELNPISKLHLPLRFPGLNFKTEYVCTRIVYGSPLTTARVWSPSSAKVSRVSFSGSDRGREGLSSLSHGLHGPQVGSRAVGKNHRRNAMCRGGKGKSHSLPQSLDFVL